MRVARKNVLALANMPDYAARYEQNRTASVLL